MKRDIIVRDWDTAGKGGTGMRFDIIVITC